MSKYEVIENIMESTRFKENDKVYAIEMFLKGWWTEEDTMFMWEEV